jgi:hypothetical protein
MRTEDMWIEEGEGFSHSGVEGGQTFYWIINLNGDNPRENEQKNDGKDLIDRY